MTTTIGAETRSREVTVLGNKTHYLREGNGPTLLFLHGTDGVDGWTPWMDRLADSFDVIVPDHPGWGRSGTPEWFDNVHDLAYFYLDFMQALDLKNVHLIGNSIGGWIACEIAVRDTKNLGSLILVDSAGLRVKGAKRVDIFLGSHESNVYASFHDAAFAERALAEPLVDERLDLFLKNRYASARVGWQPRLYDPHLAKWLHRIDIPTLVLWGERDRILPLEMMDEFVRLIPHAKGVVIPDCGHLPHVERTDAFLDAVTTFLAGESA